MQNDRNIVKNYRNVFNKNNYNCIFLLFRARFAREHVILLFKSILYGKTVIEFLYIFFFLLKINILNLFVGIIFYLLNTVLGFVERKKKK